MTKSKEIRTAMPSGFVKEITEKAEDLGMTPRQLIAVCISLGFKALSKIEGSPLSLPSEPSPFSAEKVA